MNISLSHAACTWTYAFRIYITRQSYAGGLANRTGDMRHAEYPQFDLLDDSVAWTFKDRELLKRPRVQGFSCSPISRTSWQCTGARKTSPEGANLHTYHNLCTVQVKISRVNGFHIKEFLYSVCVEICLSDPKNQATDWYPRLLQTVPGPLTPSQFS
jgi:hypothetical protein